MMNSKNNFNRVLNLKELLKKKSHFLLGPRATGKSSLIKSQLGQDALILDLLKSDLFLRLSAAPEALEAIIDFDRQSQGQRIVVIDEVQKIPHILDEVHRLIEDKGITFLLTGSSARKLKSGQSNLLAGRAWESNLFPLSFCEIPNFDLDRYLRVGGLPAVYKSENPEEELDAYVNLYLMEEIQAEGLVRKLPQFSRFLQQAAQTSGEVVNFAKRANDAQLPPSTVREYYQILEDTLLGTMILPWQSKVRKAIATSKWYLFDTGVAHVLSGLKQLDRQSSTYGKSFEHWIVHEIQAKNSYGRHKLPLYFWRSQQQHEVDFVIPDHLAVEVKASQQISERDARGLRAFQEEKAVKHLVVVSQDPTNRLVNGIQYMHWKVFMEQLWGGGFF